MIRWDEPKRAANLEKHGLDFADTENFAWEDALVVSAKASKRGRPHFKAIGPLGRDVVLIFSPLGAEAISVISLRRASRKERKAYAEC